MTLTQVSIITRRGVIALAALTILSIISAGGYRVWYNYYLSTLPLMEEKPNLKFGVLPKINFTEAKASSSNYSYSIDTETGNFPQMPKIIKVYFIPRASIISLLAPDESQRIAEAFGFQSGRQVLNPTYYKYSDESGGSLMFDLITGNFHSQKIIATPSAIINNSFSSDQPKIITDFKEFLKSKSILNSDLATGRTKVVYNEQTSSASASANVSIWPSDSDNLPIVTSSITLGPVRAIVQNTVNESEKYPRVDYTYWQIDKTTFGTYPLESIENAFAKLQSGLGFVTKESPSAKVSITKAFLAYFESEEYTPYLQPVYVFEGPQFSALVPAIKSGQ